MFNYMNTLHFKVSGLTCEACVKLITNRIKKISGVSNVNINLKTGEAEVMSEGEINLEMIKQSLANTTYKLIL